MATSVVDNDVASNVKEENLSSHEDPNANCPVSKTDNSTRLSKDAIDKKAGAETKVLSAETKVWTQRCHCCKKKPLQGRRTGFGKQEILILAKAYMRASSDPIVGISQSEETFYQKVCNNYNQLVAGWNKENDDSKCFMIISWIFALLTASCTKICRD